MSSIFKCIVMKKKGYMMSNTLDLYQTLHFNINFASVQTAVKMSLVFNFLHMNDYTIHGLYDRAHCNCIESHLLTFPFL